MGDELVTMPPKFRLALLGKGVLLLAIAGLFAVLSSAAWSKWHWPLLARSSAVVLMLLAAVYVGWAALLALLDVVRGQAITSSGAKPLKSRRSGYSLRLPSGRFVEYVLYNPWQPLDREATYTVTYGRHSGVLVAPPVEEARR